MSWQNLAFSIVFSVALAGLVADDAGADEKPGDEIEQPEYYPDEQLEADALKQTPLRELSLMRNTIYARAGHEFSTDWLQQYFDRQDWYEGGGLDDDALTERDRRNVRTILDVEAGLHERELRNRREQIWDDHDGLPSDGQWSFPGPFEERQEAIEARLIDEALEELLEETDSYHRPWDPGSDDLDADGPLPTNLGEVSLGDPVDGLDLDDLADGLHPVEFVDDDMRLLPVADDEDEVEQIVALSRRTTVPSPGIIRQLVEDGDDNPENRLTLFTRLVTEIAGSIGAPDHAEPPESPSHGPALSWEDGDHYLQVHYVGSGQLGVPSVAHVRLVLRPDDPDRICGADDGFESWYEEFIETMKSGDGEEIAEYFDFPFPDNAAGIGGWVPDPSREFESREEFLKRDSYDDLKPGDDADPRCTTRRRGYGVLIPNKGGLQFERVDGDWKAVRIGRKTYW